ncbi:MAG TPA: hypothetical protein VFA37_10315 [Gaiellaceae bacterium]|nr:hypothetical protein [Gaiellaceae bacterium]
MRRTILGGVLVLALLGAGAALAKAKTDSVHVAVSPARGRYGTKYAVKVTGTAVTSSSLIVAMAKKGLACPASYAKGLKSLYGITSVAGKTVQPMTVHGKLATTLHAEMGVKQPGKYRICGYLNDGRTTLALGSAPFAVTR